MPAVEQSEQLEEQKQQKCANAEFSREEMRLYKREFPYLGCKLRDFC